MPFFEKSRFLAVLAKMAKNAKKRVFWGSKKEAKKGSKKRVF
jgi:hypothetical protein